MATNNSGNGQIRESRPATNNYKKEGKSFSGANGKKEFRQGNGEKRNGEYKSRTDRNAKNGEHRQNGGFRSGNNNSFRGGNGVRKGFDKGFDKDADEEREVRRRPVAKDNKPKEQQSDKMEVKNRLEKEKKAIKKKQSASQKDGKSVKHQVRPKRSGNVDWTRAYENDSYDDDDFDMYY